jgi:hypothetical protein
MTYKSNKRTIATRECAARLLSSEKGPSSGKNSGSTKDTIPKVNARETRIPVEDSHHWRRSILRQLSGFVSGGLVAVDEETFIADSLTAS